ncbi:MAG TPA: hypothetical protein PLP19_10275 [bacterium]|nr:hypothetical protein [bacterium]HPN43865.1 hypothetical protein [bacterium]
MQLRKICFITGCVAFWLTACDNPLSTSNKSGELSRTQYAVYSCPHGMHDPAWSPDGERIAFVAQVNAVDLFKVSSVGDTLGKVNRFYHFITKNRSSISPDENYIIYSDYYEDINTHRKNAYLYATEQDTNFLVNDIIPASAALYKWSEDSRLVYFQSYENSIFFINAITPAGAPVFKVALNSTREFSDYCVAPDQQSIVWSCKPNDKQFWELWLYTQQNGAQLLLAADSIDFIHPVWSPDGKSIAFHAFNYKTSNRSLEVYSFNNNSVRSVVNGLDWYIWIVWASDGQAIYFSGNFLNDQQEGVWTVSLPDNNITLKYQVEQKYILQLNDDGSVFTSSGNKSIFYIYAYSLNDKRVTSLTPGCEEMITRPAWSPDGANLVFSLNYELYRIPGGGGTPERLKPYRTMPQYNPDYSPDGSLLAFDNGNYIYVTYPGSMDEKRISEAPSLSNPVWSPDGKQLLCIYKEYDNDSLIVYDYINEKLQRSNAWPGQYTDISWSKPHSLYGENLLVKKLVRGSATGDGYILQIRNVKTEQVFTLIGDNGSLSKSKSIYIGACWAPNAESIAWIQREGLSNNYSLNIARIFTDIK